MRLIFFLLLFAVCGCNYLFKPKYKIIDNNFAAAIRRQCPVCIDTADYLTKHADTLTFLDVFFSEINSLEGFHFKSLVEFNCANNNISALPDNLPTSLQTLSCADNNISRLPDIQLNRLTMFNCNRNQISQIPQGFFSPTLVNLYCTDNKITKLPDNLPVFLSELDCSYNQISQLPEKLPTPLQHLSCNHNLLTELPENLPDFLSELYCANNQLTTLPKQLPNSLEELDCANNQISHLPVLPVQLSYLRVDDYLKKDIPNNPAIIFHLVGRE